MPFKKQTKGTCCESSPNCAAGVGVSGTRPHPVNGTSGRGVMLSPTKGVVKKHKVLFTRVLV